MGHPRISHFKTQDLSRLCFPFGPGHLENVTKPGWYYPLWSAQFPLEIIQTGHHEVSRRPPGGWATPHNNSSFNKHRMQHYGSRKGNNCLYVERSERASQRTQHLRSPWSGIWFEEVGSGEEKWVYFTEWSKQIEAKGRTNERQGRSLIIAWEKNTKY